MIEPPTIETHHKSVTGCSLSRFCDKAHNANIIFRLPNNIFGILPLICRIIERK